MPSSSFRQANRHSHVIGCLLSPRRGSIPIHYKAIHEHVQLCAKNLSPTAMVSVCPILSSSYLSIQVRLGWRPLRCRRGEAFDFAIDFCKGRLYSMSDRVKWKCKWALLRNDQAGTVCMDQGVCKHEIAFSPGFNESTQAFSFMQPCTVIPSECSVWKWGSVISLYQMH